MNQSQHIIEALGEGIGVEMKKKIKAALDAGGADVRILAPGQVKDRADGFTLVGDADAAEKAKRIMAKVKGVTSVGVKPMSGGNFALTYKIT